MSISADLSHSRVFSSALLVFIVVATWCHPSSTIWIRQVDGFVVVVVNNKKKGHHNIQSFTPLSLPSLIPLHLTTTLHYPCQKGDGDDLMVPTPNTQGVIGTIAFLVPSGDVTKTPQPLALSKFGIHSPVDRPSYLQAAKHLASKATWFSENQVNTVIVETGDDYENNNNDDDADLETIRTTLENASILIAMGLSTKSDLEFAQSIFLQRKQQRPEVRFAKCQFALDCDTSSSKVDLPSMVGPYDKESSSTSSNPSLLLPWTDAASGRRFDEQMEGLFDRWTSDDFTVALMLFLNQFSGSAVDWVKDSADATWEKGPIRNAQEFYQMGEFVLISFHCFLYVTVSSSPLHILHSISSTFSNQMWRLSGEMSWKRKLQNMP
jgi:hypothetical protein